jgi:hypothetical protein
MNVATYSLYTTDYFLGLGYAIPMFEARGITTPQSLTVFGPDDFELGVLINTTFCFSHRFIVGVTAAADKKRLLELVQRVKTVWLSLLCFCSFSFSYVGFSCDSKSPTITPA